MSACPFCQETMRAPSDGGPPREECGACGAQWFDGTGLSDVLGPQLGPDVVQRARGMPGICKGCSARLQYVPGCPDCGKQAPTCPTCGRAPLAVVEVRDVVVDVCVDCGGAAFDKGELSRIQQRNADAAYEPLDLRPKFNVGLSPQCTKCRRKMKPKYGFIWEERLYCGSCAPDGAVPYTDELTRAPPTENIDSTLTGESAETLAAGAVGEAASSTLSWLFTRLFRR